MPWKYTTNKYWTRRRWTNNDSRIQRRFFGRRTIASMDDFFNKQTCKLRIFFGWTATNDQYRRALANCVIYLQWRLLFLGTSLKTEVREKLNGFMCEEVEREYLGSWLNWFDFWHVINWLCWYWVWLKCIWRGFKFLCGYSNHSTESWGFGLKWGCFWHPICFVIDIIFWIYHLYNFIFILLFFPN